MNGIRVVASQEQNRMGPTGQSIKLHVVFVETDNGATGQMEVPASQWNKESLEQLLAAKRDELNLAFTL